MIVKTAYDLVPYLEAIETIKSIFFNQRSKVTDTKGDGAFLHRHSVLQAVSKHTRSNQKHTRRTQWEHPRTQERSRPKRN